MKQTAFLHRAGLCFCIVHFFLTSGAQIYDIYTYNVKTGNVNRVTHLSNSSAYNVSWSNNGKKMAHDLVGPYIPFGQSIYITDVETGITSPLSGAESGNDAAWSPNGNRIAFDLWEFSFEYWTTLNNLYVISSNGGTRTLIRQHSNHGSWSNDGNRIAFADNWFGYIGTKNLSDGSETFITYGNWPSWSPNGKYIAYNGWGGGVWVIEVDPAGNPVGSPVQLSSSGYGPTWSQNSKTIAFIDWPTGDPDLYSVPATGGVAQRLTGRIGGFDRGDYDPAYSNNGQYIAYSSFTDTAVTRTIPKKEITVSAFQLEQNSPNPFSHETRISFKLKDKNHVSLLIFNSMGQMIRQLINEQFEPGSYQFVWDGKDQRSNPVPAGVYICQLSDDKNRKVITMNVVR